MPHPFHPQIRVKHIHVRTYNCTCNYSCFKARQDYIQESRRIREEQDREYLESLRTDQKKEEDRQRAKADLALVGLAQSDRKKELVKCSIIKTSRLTPTDAQDSLDFYSMNETNVCYQS